MAKKSVIGLILLALFACQRAEPPKAKTESPPPAPAPAARLDRDSAPGDLMRRSSIESRRR